MLAAKLATRELLLKDNLHTEYFTWVFSPRSLSCHPYPSPTWLLLPFERGLSSSASSSSSVHLRPHHGARCWTFAVKEGGRTLSALILFYFMYVGLFFHSVELSGQFTLKYLRFLLFSLYVFGSIVVQITKKMYLKHLYGESRFEF